MVDKQAKLLQQRIAAGLAEPISDREREQLREMHQVYVRRFGKLPPRRGHIR